MAAYETELVELDDAAFRDALKTRSTRFVVLFHAEWCEPSKPVEQLLVELSKTKQSLRFVKLDAETSAYAVKYDVTVVPSVALLAADGALAAKVEGADPSKLVAKIEEFSKLAAPKEAAPATDAAALQRRLSQLVKSAPAMLFMKGTAAQPKCGFSRTVSELLTKAGIDFASFDILKDDAVRQGLKTYSNWPTYPQFYANGELVGGLDILQEMAAEGDLKEELGLKHVTLDDRLKALVNSAPAILFMKGSPGQERCGFSRTIVGMLREAKIEFETFDILEDDDVRQGLKTYSNWPTFPQFYVKGDLVGGLDILTEMSADGDLKEQLLGD